jgi:hypothetical protein
MTIESLVAILLLLTILYCVRLNGQLKRLKGDEATLKTTIAELMTATETAERAISGLRATVRDAEQTLGESLQLAERFSSELHRNTAAGAEVLHRLTQIASMTGTSAIKPAKPAVPDAQAIAAAAQAVSERALARFRSVAA